jgi:predicted phage-related endonuclease
MRYTINKPQHGSKEWLEVRWRDHNGLSRIAASSAAAVHGEHEYMTAGDLATELLAEEAPQPKQANAAMERGNRLEPVLIQWTADLEEVVLNTPDIMYCFENGDARMIATLDAISADGMPFEIKTTKKRWDGVLPRQWYWQGVQQSICAGTNQIEWRIFDSDLELHQYTQIITSDEQQIHISAVDEFLNLIEQGLVPEVAKLSYDNVSNLYNKSSEMQTMLPPSAMEVINELEKTKEAKKKLEEVENALKAELGLMMKNSEEGILNGDIVVTWKTQTRNVFDSTRFDKEHPALSKKYRKDTSFRVLKTKVRR